MIGLFCKRALQMRLNSAKEAYNLKEPTDRSHRIPRRDSDKHRNHEISNFQFSHVHIDIYICEFSNLQFSNVQIDIYICKCSNVRFSMFV